MEAIAVLILVVVSIIVAVYVATEIRAIRTMQKEITTINEFEERLEHLEQKVEERE